MVSAGMKTPTILTIFDNISKMWLPRGWRTAIIASLVCEKVRWLEEGVETRSWGPKEARAIETGTFPTVNCHEPTVVRVIEDVSKKDRKKVSKVCSNDWMTTLCWFFGFYPLRREGSNHITKYTSTHAQTPRRRLSLQQFLSSKRYNSFAKSLCMFWNHFFQDWRYSIFFFLRRWTLCWWLILVSRDPNILAAINGTGSRGERLSVAF